MSTDGIRFERPQLGDWAVSRSCQNLTQSQRQTPSGNPEPMPRLEQATMPATCRWYWPMGSLTSGDWAKSSAPGSAIGRTSAVRQTTPHPAGAGGH